ncbi:hypothetical protein N7481_012512 [Penicillium waksmanii]|uniref:uncharacterized protein n=1 Tax=Penicillium waksmanii TaxID=69791 RepID=UPI002547A35C|nr:uncharacterized protein N7481_012512 [Penicillium waksmanii]KAJ5965798.1 hypothetical protein N7481_012512 [Penicillium waksmanii]
MSLVLSDNPAPQPLTDIFTNDTNIVRRKCHRTVPMKVLALGVGRTGTASLRKALEQLGYAKCYHMLCASVENPPDCLMWHDALNAKYKGKGEFGRKEWDQLLGDCQAVCDWPACAFAKELIEAYPDAKVILNIRDIDQWHTSVTKTVYWRVSDPEHKFLANFSWAAGMYYPMLNKFFETFFRGDFPNKGKQIYKEHVAEVRSLVPPERLLEYSINDGWDPLCKFLEEEIPHDSFPHGNDVADFRKRCNTRNYHQAMNALLQAITISGSLLVTGLAVIMAFKHFTRPSR